MWPNRTAVIVVCLAGVVESVCSMKNLPKFEGEYIHYLLSWDCKLTVTRSWSGSSLREFKIASDRLDICKPDGTGDPIHYVQVPSEANRSPHLVFIIHFHKETGSDRNLWRVVRINISTITYRKRLRRTILDSILTEYSTLYTNYPLRTCAYYTVDSIYCFWQRGTEQWAQLYSAAQNNATVLEYRAVSEAYHLEGHPNFGQVVGSLPGLVPRVLMFDYKIQSWLYEVPVLPNFTISGRRTQEMRQIGKVTGKIRQVAAMSMQSFIIDDCHNSVCEYRYSSLGPVAKSATTCVFTSSFDAVSGVFEMPSKFLITIQPEIEGPPSSQTIKPSVSSPVEKKQRMTRRKQWVEHSVVVIYVFTIALVLIIKLLIEVHILTLHPDNIAIFEEHCTVFYKYLFFGLTSAFQQDFSGDL